jgi:hypothetical protein
MANFPLVPVTKGAEGDAWKNSTNIFASLLRKIIPAFWDWMWKHKTSRTEHQPRFAMNSCKNGLTVHLHPANDLFQGFPA